MNYLFRRQFISNVMSYFMGEIRIDSKRNDPCEQHTLSQKKNKNAALGGSLIELGFNNMPTLVGHFVISQRKRKERRDSRGDEREGQERRENERQ